MADEFVQDRSRAESDRLDGTLRDGKIIGDTSKPAGVGHLMGDVFGDLPGGQALLFSAASSVQCRQL